jgi:hypothetical protein
MFETLREAANHKKFIHCHPILHLPAEQIEQLEWKETSLELLEELKKNVDFVPAKMYPSGMFHEAGEVGHDFEFRYYLPAED